MKRAALVACALLASALCAAQSATSAVTLSFAPAAPSKLERRITLEHDLTVRSASQLRGGNVVRSEQSAEVRTRELLAVTDELRSLADGRPGVLKRHFDEHSFHSEFVSIEGGTRGKPGVFDVRSVLDGCGVVYTWVPVEGDWGRYYDEREELEEHLADLRQDLDLLALLPKRAVAPGDAWDVPAERWVDVLAPCGRIDRRWPKEFDVRFARTLSSGIAGGLSEVFGGTSQGGGRVRLARVEGEGDARRAVLELELDVTLARDQDPATVRRGSADDTKSADGRRVHVQWRYQARGELVWSFAERRAERLSLSGKQHVEARFFSDASKMPTEEMALAGSLKIEATISRKR
jgi:hypothetical protein